MIDRSYKCNLCGDRHEARELVGLYWEGRRIIEKEARQVEHHICFACLSSIQELEQRCVGGFKCDGGPRCASDHK